MARTVRILREADVREALDMASCIDACERAFEAYSGGGAELPSVIHLDVPESKGEIHVKAGHLHGQPYYAVKVGERLLRRRPAAIDGLVMVFDARTERPRRSCWTAGTSPTCGRARRAGSRRGTWRPNTSRWSR